MKTVCLSFETLDVDDTLRHGAKRVLTWYAENSSPSHLVNSFSRFKHFAAQMKPRREITSLDLINYRASLDSPNLWYMGALAGLLKRWHAMFVPGVTDDADTFLRSIRTPG